MAVLALSHRLMVMADLSDILQIEQSVQVDPWSMPLLLSCLRPDYLNYIAIIADSIVGFTITKIIVDECHLMNIAVKLDYQGQGIASYLLTSLFDELLQKKIRHCFLEVRCSNQIAYVLYKKLGFEQTRIRKGYYRTGLHGPEDAYEMHKLLLG